MDELQYELLASVTGRLEAEFLKSYLEAEGIDAQLFQESVGQIFAITIEDLGHVDIFVPKEKITEARELLKEYYRGDAFMPNIAEE